MVRKFGAFISLVLIAAGIICIIYRLEIAKIIAVVAGAMVLVIGASYALSSVFEKKKGEQYGWKLVIGIFLSVLGIYMIINSDITISIVGIFTGIIAFAAGIDRFHTAYTRIKVKESPVAAIIMGIIHILFGIGMCIAPIYGVSIMVMILGIYTLSAGIMIFMSAVKFGDL